MDECKCGSIYRAQTSPAPKQARFFMSAWAAQKIMRDKCAGAGCIVKRSFLVMRGLDPRIHPSSSDSFEEDGLPGQARRGRSSLSSAQLFQHVGRGKSIRRRADRGLETA